MSSCVHWDSMGSTHEWLMKATTRITQRRPQVHIRTLVHRRHTMEVAPPSGPPGIDFHLGQKPKLGGRYTDNPLISISYLVGTLYIHVSLSFAFVLFVVVVLFCLSKTQKAQKYFCCFSSFASLAS